MSMKALISSLLVLAAAARPAGACGVPDFGAVLAGVAEAFDPKTERIGTPLIVLGGGATSDGTMGSVALGYGWGDKDHGGLFPGSTITRVLLGLRSDGDLTYSSLTYGWYTNAIGTLGLDLGAEAQLSGTRSLGPVTRLTLGTSGVAVRFSGGAQFNGANARVTGAAEIVLDVMDLGHAL